MRSALKSALSHSVLPSLSAACLPKCLPVAAVVNFSSKEGIIC